jgi:hypothetical protein
MGAMKTIPSFDAGEVELLVSAVQKKLENLREAIHPSPRDGV